MKKTFQLEIKSPCHENFDKMIPNSNGSFCSSCVKNVIDLSTKSDVEISKFMSKVKDKNSICVRLNSSQLETNFDVLESPKNYNFKYAVAVAASVLLTSSLIAQKKQVPKDTIETTRKQNKIVGEPAYIEHKSQTISFIFKGKLLDKTTNKPLNTEDFPNITIIVFGGTKSVKVNPETGVFSIPITIDENTKNLSVTILRDGMQLIKQISFTKEKNSNGIFTHDIIIDTEEFPQSRIMGKMIMIKK